MPLNITLLTLNKVRQSLVEKLLETIQCLNLEKGRGHVQAS